MLRSAPSCACDNADSSSAAGRNADHLIATWAFPFTTTALYQELYLEMPRDIFYIWYLHGMYKLRISVFDEIMTASVTQTDTESHARTPSPRYGLSIYSTHNQPRLQLTGYR